METNTKKNVETGEVQKNSLQTRNVFLKAIFERKHIGEIEQRVPEYYKKETETRN